MPSILESIEITISDDKTVAYLTIPENAGEHGDRIDYAQFVAQLTQSHKLSGIKEDVLASIVDAYNDDRSGADKVEIASSGRPMVPGVDGYLEWKLERDPALSENEEGKVDFYQSSALKSVKEGDLLAELHPPRQGSSGVSVTGESLVPPPAKELIINAGENVEMRMNENTFYALRPGRVELRGSTIVVSKSYEVEGDVDFSSGNLKFDGFIHVRGNVQDNFQVEAKEGVQVDKVVEAAHVISGGSMTVLGGINCRGKGSIRAKGDLSTKFINNAEVHCHGTVRVEREILNSKVFADRIEAKLGQASGGELVAVNEIVIKEAGSPMGVKTVLQVGRNPFVDSETADLEKSAAMSRNIHDGLHDRLEMVEPVKDKVSARSKEGIGALRARKDHIKGELDRKQNKLENLKKQQLSTEGSIIIQSVIHAGVTIKIGRYEKTMTKTFDGYRRFAFDKQKLEIVAFFS